MICETVRVVAPVTEGRPHGFIVINLSDLTNEHVLFEDQPEPTVSVADSVTAEPAAVEMDAAKPVKRGKGKAD